jgi:hypothetical protein
MVMVESFFEKMYGEAMQRKYLRTKASEKDERQKGFL